MTGLLSKEEIEASVVDDTYLSDLDKKKRSIQQQYEDLIKKLQTEQEEYLKRVEKEQNEAKAKQENSKRMLGLYKQYENEFSSIDNLIFALRLNKDGVLDNIIVHFGLQSVDRHKVITELVSILDKKQAPSRSDKEESAKLFDDALGVVDTSDIMGDFVLNLGSSSKRMRTQSQSYSYRVKDDELVYLSIYDGMDFNAFSLYDVVYGGVRFPYSNGVDFDTLNTLGVNLMSVVDPSGVKHWLVTHLDSRKYMVFDSVNTSDYQDGGWSYSGSAPFLTKSAYFTMLILAAKTVMTVSESDKFTAVLRSGLYKYVELERDNKSTDNWYGVFQFMEILDSNRVRNRNSLFRTLTDEPVCITTDRDKTSLLNKSLINNFLTYTLEKCFGEARAIEICKSIHIYGGYDEVSQDIDGRKTDVIKLI